MFSELFLESVQKVSLYFMYVSEDKKTKCIPNKFLWSILDDFYAFIRAYVMNHVTLFGNVYLIEVSWVW